MRGLVGVAGDEADDGRTRTGERNTGSSGVAQDVVHLLHVGDRRGAVRLVEPVGERRAEKLGAPGRDRRREQTGVRDVEGGVGVRNRLGQHRARGLGRELLVRDDHDDSEPAGRLEARGAHVAVRRSSTR